MKVYMLAITDGRYMVPVGSGKIYKNKGNAKKALNKYCEKHPSVKNAKLLYADNWHSEED